MPVSGLFVNGKKPVITQLGDVEISSDFFNKNFVIVTENNPTIEASLSEVKPNPWSMRIVRAFNFFDVERSNPDR